MPVHTHFLKAGRQLMHLYLETARPPSLSLRQTYVKPYVYKKSLFTKEGRELRKFTYKTEDGFTEEINIWKLHKPRRGLWSPYERFSQASKDRIANDSNTAVYESTVKKDVLGQLVLYLYTNKVMSIKQMAEACEVPQSRIRKYKDEAQDALRKLHKLKVTAFQPY